MLQLILVTFFSAPIIALPTGIGGVPFLFTRRLPERLVGLAWGFSGGMMLSASVFNLVFEGIKRAGYNAVAAGLALGALLFWFTERRFGHTTFNFYHVQGAPARRIVLFLGTLFIHSFSEGIAVGVVFGSGEVALAALVTIAIAIHNIPAALAVAFFQPLVPIGLGFAAGAMGFLVFSEMIPEAEERSGHGNGAAAVIVGFLAMMLMQNVLQ